MSASATQHGTDGIRKMFGLRKHRGNVAIGSHGQRRSAATFSHASMDGCILPRHIHAGSLFCKARLNNSPSTRRRLNQRRSSSSLTLCRTSQELGPRRSSHHKGLPGYDGIRMRKCTGFQDGCGRRLKRQDHQLLESSSGPWWA